MQFVLVSQSNRMNCVLFRFDACVYFCLRAVWGADCACLGVAGGPGGDVLSPTGQPMLPGTSGVMVRPPVSVGVTTGTSCITLFMRH